MKRLRLPLLMLALVIAGCNAIPRKLDITINPEQRAERHEYARQHTYRVEASEGMGSGWAWDEDTLITCGHVVMDSLPELVVIRQGRQEWVVLSITRIGEEDAARIEVDGPPLQVAPKLATIPAVGEWVTMAGYPWGQDFISTEGAILGRYFWRDLVVDGTVLPGMSGGPVFDGEGRVCGMNRAITLPPGRSVGLLIPLNRILLTY